MRYGLVDLAFNPDQPRDRHGRWSSSPLSKIEQDALDSWTSKRGGVRRIQHGALAETFDSAVRKLPPATGPVYRGVTGSGADRQARLNVGDTLEWDEPKSASTAPAQAFGFGANIYQIDTDAARSLEGHSKFAYEKEAVLPPGQYEVTATESAKWQVGKHSWPVYVVHLKDITKGERSFAPKRSLDLASPGVKRRERAVEKHAVHLPVDSDQTVRTIAKVLSVSSRLPRVGSDFKAEAEGLELLLEEYGIHGRAIRMALGLAHHEGGGRKGTAHVPNARLAEHGATLDERVREVRDSEVYYRAAYLANAAKRIQTSLNGGASPKDAMRREAPYYRAHEEARRGRLRAVAQVQTAARTYGEEDDRGTLVGWYLNPLLKNEVECITANGHNFYAEEGTVIGLPGSVHNRCGCYAGPPHEGATLVNDAMKNVVAFRRTRPKFKLRSRTA